MTSVPIDPALIPIMPSLEPLVERRLRARSQEAAHDRARAVTSEMSANGWDLIARSWADAARGGTATLVFARRDASEQDPADPT